MAQKKIKKDLMEIMNNTSPNFSAGLISDDDMFNWNGFVKGPEDSAYKGGVFFINISLPSDYPFKAPKVSFQTKIYHPNINANGTICLAILKEEWSPSQSIYKILLNIYSILSDPVPENSLVPEIGTLYMSDKPAFEKIASEWTKKYAM